MHSTFAIATHWWSLDSLNSLVSKLFHSCKVARLPRVARDLLEVSLTPGANGSIDATLYPPHPQGGKGTYPQFASRIKTNIDDWSGVMKSQCNLQGLIAT